MEKVEELIKLLEKVKQKNNVEGIKVYYTNPEEYSVKGITNGEIICVARKRASRNVRWDMPKPIDTFNK